MKKLLFLKGLPGSGKSVFAKDLIAKEPEKWIRINKDDLRKMFHDGKWTKMNEKIVVNMQRNLASFALAQGYSIVIDDTNLNPQHEQHFRELAKTHNSEFEVKEFDIDVEECIRRDAERLNSVGRKVIMKMYRQKLPKVSKPDYIEGKPNAIIVDMDGTLAIMQDRGAFDWHKVGGDILNEPIADIVKNIYFFGEHYSVIIVSGRDKCCESETIEWLREHNIPWVLLCMRKEEDKRQDSIVKREIYENSIKGNYNIKFVLDDRDQVVDLWRSLGLTCLQCNYGDF